MKKLSRLMVLFLLGAGFLIGVLTVTRLEWLPRTNAESVSAPAATPETAQQEIAVVKGLNSAFVAIAEKANPSVVTIFTNKVVRQRVQGPYASPFFSDPFRQFFGGPQGQMPEREQVLQGMGSGVIVSSDGYILTNNQVAGDADELQVMLLGDKKVQAKLIGRMPKRTSPSSRSERRICRPRSWGIPTSCGSASGFSPLAAR